MAADQQPAGHDARTPVSVVAHTHWDREWYRPFQAYRHDLVRLLDDLLPRLAADPGFRHFLLDGQTIVVDDYLEVRPGAAAVLGELAAAGRLAFGPWAVLLDEFCVGGETIVRNLQRGQARAAALGGTLAVGYLPDMFGHVAQMPQLLRQAGLEHAVVWRGVPAAVDRTAFWWEAPDGSRVRAEHLWGSYANGRDITTDPARLVAVADSYAIELGARALAGGGLLLMHGGDHRAPVATLPEVVAAANDAQERWRFTIASLAEHVAAQPTEGLPTWRGELRSGAHTNLLMGVLSNRVDVHQATAAAERALVEVAEPLAALFVPALPPDAAPPSPVPFLELAWDRLIANSAHDSACACSVDAVVDHVLVRAREAHDLADAVTAEALRWLAATVDAPPGSWVVANPSARARGGVVEVETDDPGPGPVGPAQVVERTAAVETLSQLVVGPKIGWVEQLLEGTTFAGDPVAHVEVREGAAVEGVGDAEVVIRLAGPGEPAIDVTAVRQQLRPLAGADRLVRVRAVRRGRTRWAVAVAPVPGLGWSTIGRAPDPTGGPAGGGSADAAEAADAGAVAAVSAPAGVGGFGLANGLVTISVEEAGTLHVVTADGLVAGGLARLVDGGDGGDTYNFSPPPADRIVEAPESVAVTLAESGPVRGRLVVAARYRWPTHAVGDERRATGRSSADAAVTVTTTYELRVGEAFVRVRHAFANPSRDHRLRAHFPLPARVTGSHAECAYAVVERGLVAEGGPHEPGLATWPSRRFVDASDPAGGVGVALVHDGLLEHEVVADGGELALTLLRSVGWLSRHEPDGRPNPAGPALAVPAAQLLGERTADYAVVVHRGGWAAADLHAVAARVLTPLPVVPVGAAGTSFATRPATGSVVAGLDLGRAELAALHRPGDRTAGAVEARLFNPHADPVTVRLPIGSRCVDLLGAPVAHGPAPDGTLTLGPAAIATVRLAADAVPAAWPPAPRPAP